MTANSHPPDVGVVVIGRNEGERLRRCLASLEGMAARVYVDSGSTDRSREVAASAGVAVVELSLDTPFTAARARNAGVARLATLVTDLAFVQFVDGDCEVQPGWIAAARARIEVDPACAVVFGRRRERRPLRNIYHAACDDEWAVPVGQVNACGGDALVRLAAFREVDGFNPVLIAGEEPDMCLRLRQRGWTIRSTGEEMTLHDVDITRFGQWWRRSQRTGFALADLVRRHGARADPAWRRLLRSASAWSACLVAGVLLIAAGLVAGSSALLIPGAAALLLVLAQGVRLGLTRGFRWSWLIMSAKAAQAWGLIGYWWQKRHRRQARLIEYK